ncbi:glutaredoxin family protein [sulfur-oxidizing endosymbiont of Gigantopelta aegis]|uniref:glutaredoxin family protein n=1 Tax=sulfur-oxidizing endosymbiont of Gigantopelta aegis TaxID=2794934 RepID=UPI0018DDC245|nr:thioredoxin family protein [sulfur-oxidizing endosymbiont of Gigantopelta aegis]
MNIEIFSSPGCGKCGHAKVVLSELANEIGGDKINWREVNILEEIDYAVELGVMTTPSIAIDGELIFLITHKAPPYFDNYTIIIL